MKMVDMIGGGVPGESENGEMVSVRNAELLHPEGTPGEDRSTCESDRP